LLPVPSEPAQAVAARHLAGHGIEPFVVDLHVYRGGQRLPTQHLLWDPVRSLFDCDLCDTRFMTGEITQEMVQHAQLFDPGLRPFLAGANTAAERDEITRRYLSGELTAAVIDVARRSARRRVPKQARPSIEHRVAKVQEWMLDRYVELGVVERVIEEALRLQRDEPERWAVVCDVPRAASTLRRDWQHIDTARVEEAQRLHAIRRGKS
jgi:hypothetical protein